MADDMRRLLALCAVRVDGKSIDWSLLARCALAGALDQLYAGTIPESSPAAEKSLPLLRAGLAAIGDVQQRVDVELAAGEAAGARLLTVLDAGYPLNLRAVADLPPFLFVRGTLDPTTYVLWRLWAPASLPKTASGGHARWPASSSTRV